MKKTKYMAAWAPLALTLSLALVLATGCTKDNDSPRPVVVDIPAGEAPQNGEILVKFRPEVSEMLDRSGAKTRAAGANAVMTRSGVDTVDKVLDIIDGYSLERVFTVDPRHEARTREAGLHLWYTVRFDSLAHSPADVAARFAQLGEIAKIEFNRTLKRTFTGKATPAGEVKSTRGRTRAAFPFDDPKLPMQWHYANDGVAASYGFADGTIAAGSDAGCLAAWQAFADRGWSTGDPSIIVAVMDEGVQYDHPDLAANMWINEDEILRSDKDNDGNGFEGDVFGYNFCDKRGLISTGETEDTGHGTHVAGTIAAVNNNGIGVSGIAGGDGSPDSGVKIMSIQIFAGNRGVTLPNEVRGIKYAADNGAVILQCSWGYMSALANGINYGKSNGLYDDEIYAERYGIEKEAFDYFIHNAGSPNGVIDGGLVIFASGNEYAAMSAYPGADADFISVSAVGGDFTPTPYTNYATGVDISAPGGDVDYHQTKNGQVLSTLLSRDDEYGYMEGTSMACPHVSGVAALGLAYAAKMHKHFDSREYRSLILKSVKDIDSHLRGEKTYFDNHDIVGEVHPTKVDLGYFRGKMGSGVIDAGLLIENIAADGAGTAIRLPNLLVATGGSVTTDLSRCFDGGETATFTASSANPAVATVVVEGSTLRVTGVADGSTSFTVSTGAQSQSATITVAKNIDNNGGWMR
jgi:subtilisin family serine protease